MARLQPACLHGVEGVLIRGGARGRSPLVEPPTMQLPVEETICILVFYYIRFLISLIEVVGNVSSLII